MRTIALVLPLLLASPALAQSLTKVIVPGTACAPNPPTTQCKQAEVSSGINGENLDDDPVTDPLQHRAGGAVYLTALVTANTSTHMDVGCEESPTGVSGTWTWIHTCDNADPRACVVELERYTFTEETEISIVITDSQPYLRCTFFGNAGGTGTIIVRGAIP